MRTTNYLSRVAFGFVLGIVWASLFGASAFEIHQDETEGAVATSTVSSPTLLRSQSPAVRRRRLNSYGSGSTDTDTHWDSEDDDSTSDVVNAMSFSYAKDEEEGDSGSNDRSFLGTSYFKDEEGDSGSNDRNLTHDHPHDFPHHHHHDPPHHHPHNHDDDESMPSENDDYDDDDYYYYGYDDDDYYSSSKSGEGIHYPGHNSKGKGKGSHHFSYSKAGKGSHGSIHGSKGKGTHGSKSSKSKSSKGSGSYDSYGSGSWGDDYYYKGTSSESSESSDSGSSKGKFSKGSGDHSTPGKGNVASTRSERVKDWESTIFNEIFGHIDVEDFSYTYTYDSGDHGFGSRGKKIKNIDSSRDIEHNGKGAKKGGMKMMGDGGRSRSKKNRTPTGSPTGTPTGTPTGSPVATPTTEAPTGTPTGTPTRTPTGIPAETPTGTPTGSPVATPTTDSPTGPPTGSPVATPSTEAPTGAPTGTPTASPVATPTTDTPTGTPTLTPTGTPTGTPTDTPTVCVDPVDPPFVDPVCGHTCDCFTCGDVVFNGDGTKSITVEHCKSGDTISWMCCTGYDTGTGNCEVTGCTPESGTAKCNTVGEQEFIITLPEDATTFNINTHDGQTSGSDDMNNVVCGGNGNQGGKCTNGENTAHCQIEFNILEHCHCPTYAILS